MSDSVAPTLPTPAPVAVAWPKERLLLSTEVPRLDGPVKVDGRAKYSYDIQFPDLLYGRILRSPHAAANIRSIDVERARALPGVRAVLLIAKEGTRIRYAGEEVVAVAAVSKQVADDALKLIAVDYEVLPHVVNVQAAPRRRRSPRFRQSREHRHRQSQDARQRGPGVCRRGVCRRGRISHAGSIARLPGNPRPDRQMGR